MYHDLPPLKCSKCGSTHTETFANRLVTGTRCMTCGHTVTKPHLEIGSSHEGWEALNEFERTF